MEIKVPVSLKEFKIVYLDDHLLFSNAMSQQCIYPYFPNASLIQFTNGNSAHDYLKNAIKSHDKIDLFITDINHPGMLGDFYRMLFVVMRRILLHHLKYQY